MERIKKLWRSVSMGGLTRMKQQVLLNPGFKYQGENQEIGKYLFRLPKLEVFSRYMDNTQYQHLPEWNGNLINQQNDDRKAQPKKIYPLPRIASDIFSGLLTSSESRLEIRVEDEEKQEKIDTFLKKAMFWACVKDAFSSFYANGSMFIRFYLTPDKKKIILEPYNTKSCWPVFDAYNELEEVTMRYIYDTGKFDSTHKPIWKWSQYKMTKDVDIDYDNPIFEWDTSKIPTFKPKTTFKHGFGFVQGVWIKNGFNNSGDDGLSLLEDALDYIDDFNYLSSKESNALYHSLYPTMVGFGVDEADFDSAVGGLLANERVSGGSSIITTEKPPKSADLRFLEGSNAGPELTDIYQQRNIQLLQHIMRISLPNPEVLLGYAQSAEAMKMLYRPVIEEIKKMREFLEEGLCTLLQKMEIAGANLEYPLPSGTMEEAKKQWGEMFTATETDRKERIASTVEAVNAMILSRESAVKHISQDFGIDNVEEEMKKIDEEGMKQQAEEIMSFKEQSDIEAKNNPKPAPAGAKPKAGGKSKPVKK